MSGDEPGFVVAPGELDERGSQLFDTASQTAGTTRFCAAFQLWWYVATDVCFSQRPVVATLFSGSPTSLRGPSREPRAHSVRVRLVLADPLYLEVGPLRHRHAGIDSW